MNHWILKTKMLENIYQNLKNLTRWQKEENNQFLHYKNNRLLSLLNVRN